MICKFFDFLADVNVLLGMLVIHATNSNSKVKINKISKITCFYYNQINSESILKTYYISMNIDTKFKLI
jgi:hypothetical protein